MTVDVLGDSNRGVPHLFRHDLQGNFHRDQERRTRVSKLVDGPVTRPALSQIFGTVLPNCSGSSGVPIVEVKIKPHSLLHRLPRTNSSDRKSTRLNSSH